MGHRLVVVRPVTAMVEVVVVSQCLKGQFAHEEIALLGSSISSSFV